MGAPPVKATGATPSASILSTIVSHFQYRALLFSPISGSNGNGDYIGSLDKKWM